MSIVPPRHAVGSVALAGVVALLLAPLPHRSHSPKTPDDSTAGSRVTSSPSAPPLRAVASVLPMTYAVSLLQGIWRGEGWIAHAGDVLGLVLAFLLCTAISARVFRWE